MKHRVLLSLLAGVMITTPVAARAEPCTLGPISYVFIDNQSIFDTRVETARRFSWVYRTANRLHIRTRRSFIARELLFGPGDCYDPVLIEESERLLRSYDFLAQIEIYGLPQPDGTYHVIVSTRDEWSTQADIRFALRDGLEFEGGRVREANLLGRGESLTAYYVQREVTRDYGVRFHTPQFAATRWDLEVGIGRSRAGTTFSQLIAYPFVGDVSRWAARQEFSREDQYFDYVASTESRGPHVLLPTRNKQFELAVMTRLGRRGNLTLLGASLSHQQLTYPGAPRIARRGRISARAVTDTTMIEPALRLREDLSSIRFGLVVGQRNVWYVKRRGLDSMRGLQDVKLGAEAALSVARSIPALETDNDLVTSFSLYSATEVRELLVNARTRFDARRDFDAPAAGPEWEDVSAEADLLLYWRPREFSRHTLVFRASGAGAWHPRTPVQLTLGGDRNLRGYREDRFPGGRRVIATVEDRMYWGWPRRESADIGSTIFLDVGRIWPGGVPYGIDSGLRASVGVGLRASFPAGSRTTYRLDVALPIQPNPNARDLRLLISVGEQLGIGMPFGDPQLRRSRPDGAIGHLLRVR